jgi:hypothetical protein
MAAEERQDENPQYESTVEQLPFVKQFKNIRNFFRTRRAILSGEPLYNWQLHQLKQEQFIGPWSFNAVESTLAALPGVLVAACSFVFSNPSTPSSGASVLGRFYASVFSVLQPLSVPFTLMLLTYVIGYAALPSAYSQHENILAAQRKYLYLDGARGLWPQLIMAVSLAVSSLPARLGRANLLLGFGVIGAIVAFGIALIWQAYINLKVSRLDLFDYDYLTRKPDTTFMPATELMEPFGKYMLITTFGLPIIYYLLSLVLALIALGTSEVLVRIRG